MVQIIYFALLFMNLNKMFKKQIKYFLVFTVLILGSFNLFGQVNKLTKVAKKRMKYSYPTAEGFSECKQHRKKEKEHWIVYSDRPNNITYKDPYAQYPNKKIDFLKACYVIDEKNDFLELVTYDESLLPPPGGIPAMLLRKKKRFRFDDVKGVEYLGWVQKSSLLINSNAWVSEDNMKPLRYMIDIGHADILIDRNEKIKTDTVITYTSPSLAEPFVNELITPKLKDLVYVYKKSDDERKYLIGYNPSFNPTSMSTIYGWIEKEWLLEVGQQKILVPTLPNDTTKGANDVPTFLGEDENLETSLGRSTNALLDGYDVNINKKDLPPFLFNNKRHTYLISSQDQDSYETYLPVDVWDHTPNKVINISGEFVYINEFLEFKANSKKLNIILLVEQNENLQTEILHLTNSLQKLHSIRNKSELEGYGVNMGAISYNHYNVVDHYNMGGAFPGWLDFVKETADNAKMLDKIDSTGMGLESALEKAVALLEGKEKETNIIITIGANASSFDDEKLNELSKILSKVLPKLLFYQIKNNIQDSYLNFVFKSKGLLYKAAQNYKDSIQHLIVDAKNYKTRTPLVRTDETKNILLFDQESCSYQGGLAFPNINSKLHPKTFDELFENFILQIVEHNNQVEISLKEYFDGGGKERSVVTPTIQDELVERGQEAAMDTLPASSHQDQFLMPYTTTKDSSRLSLVDYYLLSSPEHESCVNQLKILAPIPPEEIKGKFRRKLYRSYKRSFKQSNKVFCRKMKVKDGGMSDLLFMGTGLPVNDSQYMFIPIKYIKRKRKISHEQFRGLLLRMREKMTILEEYPVKNQGNKYNIQDVKYVYFPAELLP